MSKEISAPTAQTKPLAYLYIRMSTTEQIAGDSQRRQLELGKQYSMEHGLDLSPDRIFEDLGVSAFRGDNAREGKLAEFIREAGTGAIAQGSCLLVESFDRLTRQNPLIGITVLSAIINAGIKIVSLTENTILDRDEANIGALLMSVLSLSRSNQESVLKSQRVSKAWENKRAHADERRLTDLGPGWLKPNAKGTHFVEIPEKVEIVKEMFELARRGLGTHAIAARLNSKRVPTFGPSQAWAKSSLNKILSSRAVVGEFQPHKKMGQKRIPAGAPIPGYFPQIISETVFNEVQRGRLLRKAKGMGRKGAEYPNLFSRIAFCGVCFSPMHYLDKGPPPKGGRYLICSGQLRKRCNAKAWRYERFEQVFLRYVRELDLDSVFSSSSRSAERDSLRSRLAEIELEKGKLDSGIDNLLNMAFEPGPAMDRVKRKIDEACNERTSLLAHQNEIEHRLAELLAEDQTASGEDNIGTLIEKLQTSTGDLQLKRASVAERIRTIVEKIEIHPETQVQSILVRWSNKKVTKTPGHDVQAPINTGNLPMFGVKRFDGSFDRYEVIQ